VQSTVREPDVTVYSPAFVNPELESGLRTDTRVNA